MTAVISSKLPVWVTRAQSHRSALEHATEHASGSLQLRVRSHPFLTAMAEARHFQPCPKPGRGASGTKKALRTKSPAVAVGSQACVLKSGNWEGTGYRANTSCSSVCPGLCVCAGAVNATCTWTPVTSAVQTSAGPEEGQQNTKQALAFPPPNRLAQNLLNHARPAPNLAKQTGNCYGQ